MSEITRKMRVTAYSEGRYPDMYMGIGGATLYHRHDAMPSIEFAITINEADLNIRDWLQKLHRCRGEVTVTIRLSEPPAESIEKGLL